MVRPGGQLLIANFTPHVLDRGYMETFMDWTLIYRDRVAMARLMNQIDPADMQSYDLYEDPNGSIVYLLLTKQDRMSQ